MFHMKKQAEEKSPHKSFFFQPSADEKEQHTDAECVEAFTNLWDSLLDLDKVYIELSKEKIALKKQLRESWNLKSEKIETQLLEIEEKLTEIENHFAACGMAPNEPSRTSPSPSS